MKKSVVFFGIFLFATVFAFAQETETPSSLLITPQDIRLVQESGNSFEDVKGYHLYILKKPNIESVLLTETTKDPEGKSDNFAYRATEWNSVNGDEIRYLNGKVLDSKYSKYSLVDSTTENIEGFGECFHIYIPSQIEYGYPWERNGSIKIGRGTFINIRSFSKKYADYTGEYYDNPYMFDLGKKVEPPKPEKKVEPEPIPEPKVLEVPVLTDDYNPIAADKFKELSRELIYSKGPETIVDDIMMPLENIPDGSNVECVFAIDATGSMSDDIEKLRAEWIPRLLVELRRFKHMRIGLVLYRDYVDSWRYKDLPVKFFDFTDDLTLFLKNLNSFTIKGFEGGDIPEAVYEALYASMEFYSWSPNTVRKVVLIGDAEPHPKPRGTGRYSKELIEKTAKQKGITINAIILPDDKSRRGR